MRSVIKKRGDRRHKTMYCIEYSNNQYIIEDNNCQVSVVFDRQLATMYYSIEEAEDAMRRLWVDGKIIRVRMEV